jgi:RNA polymerase sigma factor for flagellar operon FliA
MIVTLNRAGAESYKKIQENNDQNPIHYSALVKRMARHLMLRLPASVQLDDMLQAGMLGVIEAIKKFDSTKGASFETYASIRIRGAMIDEIRRGDWVPRSVHKNARTITATMKVIEQETGKDAKDSDVALKLGVSLLDYRQMLMDVNNGHMMDFDELGVNEDFFSRGLSENNLTPLERIQKEDFRNALAKAIAFLPQREQLILALYYDEELNLKEIGKVMDVSESRVSQLHSQAMLRLQSRLKDWTKS